MKRELKILKNWLETATAEFMNDHERYAYSLKKETQEDAERQEIAWDVRSQIKTVIAAYLNIVTGKKVADRQRRVIANLAPLKIKKSLLINRFSK